MAARARTTRRTAEERREQVLEAALLEFADHGFDGASTDAIARRVGISQPYLFRLFGTKKELFIDAVERCMADTLAEFREASEGLTGQDALDSMGRAYVQLITSSPERLQGQLQAYVAAAGDPEIRAVVRRGFGRLVEHVESLGAPPAELSRFFATGMLLNVITAMGLDTADEPWAGRLLEASRATL